MSSRRQRSIPLGGRYRQLSLYFLFLLFYWFVGCGWGWVGVGDVNFQQSNFDFHHDFALTCISLRPFPNQNSIFNFKRINFYIFKQRCWLSGHYFTFEHMLFWHRRYRNILSAYAPSYNNECSVSWYLEITQHKIIYFHPIRCTENFSYSHLYSLITWWKQITQG